MYAKMFDDAIVYYNGCDLIHREDGPAIEYKNGTRSWWLNGEPHRQGGPAIERANGDIKWRWNGVEMSLKKYCELMRNKGLMSEEEITIMILKYS